MKPSLAAALFFLVSCASAVKEWKLPPALDGGWKLGVLPPSRETYELVGRLKPKRSQMAGYENGASGQLRVAGFELANGSVAFEQVQQWKAQPGRIVFHHGAWFVIVESEAMDAAQLSKVANAVEKTMPN